MDADTQAHRHLARRGPQRIILADHAGHFESGLHRMVGMVLHLKQAAPHRHHAVADILVDHPLLALDAGAEQGEVMVEHLGGFLLVQLLGLRREAHDVGEHHRDIAPARNDRALSELHQAQHQSVGHVGTEPFQRTTRLVEAVAGIVDLAQPRTAMEGHVEFQLLDRFRGRRDGADRAGHAQPHEQRQQGGNRESDAADDGTVGQPVEIARRLLNREILPNQPRIGAEAAQFAIDEHPAVAVDLDDMAEAAERPIDPLRTNRSTPDMGQHRIVDLLDGGQRMLFGKAEAARIDQAAMRQHLVAADQDEIPAIAAARRIADQVGKVADRDRGDQAADEGIVDTAHRRTDIDHRLLDRLAPEQGPPEGVLRQLQLAEAFEAARRVHQRERVAMDLPVGFAHGAVKLEVERGEADRRNRRHLSHHHGQRLTHIDRRFDVDAAGSRQRSNQFELFADRIETAAHQVDLGIDDTGGAVDQQALGSAGRTGQDEDVGNARDQRERNEGKHHRHDQRHSPQRSFGLFTRYIGDRAQAGTS